MPYSGVHSEIDQKRVPAKTYIFMEGNWCYRTDSSLFDPYWENIGLEFHRLAKKEKNKANISSLWTEGASSKKVWWLWFYFELTDSIAHLHQRNARASKTKTLLLFFMPVTYNFRQNFWSDQTTRKKVKFEAKKFLFEYLFKNKSWSEVSWWAV